MHQRPFVTYQWGAGGEGQRHGVRYVCRHRGPRQMRFPLRATSEDAVVRERVSGAMRRSCQVVHIYIWALDLFLAPSRCLSKASPWSSPMLALTWWIYSFKQLLDAASELPGPWC